MKKGEMIECLVNYFTDGNKKKFADFLGISAQQLNNWIKRNTYNPELIYQKCTGVSAEWLLSGEGEMMEKDRHIDHSIPFNGKNLLELCRQLVANYQQRDEVMVKLVSMVKGLE